MYFDDAAHILHKSVLPDHFRLVNRIRFGFSNAACSSHNKGRTLVYLNRNIGTQAVDYIVNEF